MHHGQDLRHPVEISTSGEGVNPGHHEGWEDV